MKKILNQFAFVIKILVFIVLTYFLCVFINYLCKPKLVDVEIITGFYAEEKNSLDVVYIGGSAAFVYYEPLLAYEEYGISSYVFGANTIQPELYKYLVGEVLKRQKPKLIILDARAFEYRDRKQAPTEVAYRNTLTGTPISKEKYEFVEEYVRPKLNLYNTLPYYLDFIKFHSTSSEERYTVIESMQMMLNKYHHPYKGFYFVPRIQSQTPLDYRTDKETPMSDETNKILDDLLSYLKEQDVEVLFVVAPYIEKEIHKENFNYVERIVSENGFTFIDANDYVDEMNINFKTDLYNINHVNLFGADKYTRFICNYMKSHYELRDISNSPEWDKLLEDWHKEREETIEVIKEKGNL